MKHFNKNLLHYFLAESIAKSLPILLLPWVATHLPTDIFGAYALFAILVNLLTVFSMLGVDQSVFRFLPESKTQNTDEEKRLLGAAIIIIALSSLFFLALFGLLGEYFMRTLFDNEFHIDALDLPFITLLLSLDSLFLTALKARKETLRYAVIFGIRMILFWAAFVYGVTVYDDSRSFIGAFYISSGVNLACLLPVFYKRIAIPMQSDFRRLLRFGLPMLGIILTGILIQQADHFLIRKFLNLAEVGEYNFMYKYAWAPGMLIILLNQVWLPRLFERGNRYFDRTFNYYSGVALYTGGMLFLLIYRALILSRAWGYVPATFHISHIFPILGLSFIFYSGAQLIDSVILLKEKVSFLNRVYIGALIFNIIANIYAIPRFGLSGAATITLISFVLLWGAITGYVYQIYESQKIIRNFIRQLLTVFGLTAGGVLLHLEIIVVFIIAIIVLNYFLGYRKNSLSENQ